MLSDKDVVATIAVSDLKRARAFYEEKLGLRAGADTPADVVSYQSGSSKFLVYQSQYAGTNQATAATWSVGDDVDNIVRVLRSRGVTFESYDFPGAVREGDVHVFGSIRNAWFKDPDGNILSIVNG